MSRRRTARIAAMALALVGVFGLSMAAASQLPVSGGTLQSGVGTIGTCQPAGQAIQVVLTSAFSAGQYQTSGATLSGIAATCQGKAYRVQLVSSTGVAIDMNGATTGTDLFGTVAGTSISLTFPTTPTSGISAVALVITG